MTKEYGRSGADAPSGCQPSASAVPASQSGIPNALASAIESYQSLLARCEAAAGCDRELDVAILTHPEFGYRDIHGDGSVFDRGNDGYWTLSDFGDRNSTLPSPTGSVDDAAALLPPKAIWRRYTDQSASVYAASPYNAAAQVRHDGTNPHSFPCALVAAIIRMKLAPLLKASAIEARRAATAKTGAVHESATRQGDAQPGGSNA